MRKLTVCTIRSYNAGLLLTKSITENNNATPSCVYMCEKGLSMNITVEFNMIDPDAEFMTDIEGKSTILFIEKALTKANKSFNIRKVVIFVPKVDTEFVESLYLLNIGDADAYVIVPTKRGADYDMGENFIESYVTEIGNFQISGDDLTKKYIRKESGLKYLNLEDYRFRNPKDTSTGNRNRIPKEFSDKEDKVGVIVDLSGGDNDTNVELPPLTFE